MPVSCQHGGTFARFKAYAVDPGKSDAYKSYTLAHNFSVSFILSGGKSTDYFSRSRFESDEDSGLNQ
jgi:hypothetical protein